MTAYPANSARRMELVQKLVASADCICDYMDRLKAGTSTLKPIEYNRLLDEYRSEMIRYDRLDRQLEALQEPTKAKEYIEDRRMYQQRQKSKVKY